MKAIKYRLLSLLALAMLTAALVRIDESQVADIRASRSALSINEIAGKIREGV